MRLNLGCDNYNCRIKEDLARYSILLDIFVHVFSTILRVKVPLGLDIEDYIYICNLKIATCYTRFFFLIIFTKMMGLKSWKMIIII